MKVLVVEYDVLVQSVVVPALGAVSHHVTLIGTADSAADLLRNGLDVDVLFTDVVMPGQMTGMDLANWVRQNMTGLPVVGASGYSSQPTRGVV